MSVKLVRSPKNPIIEPSKKKIQSFTKPVLEELPQTHTSARYNENREKVGREESRNWSTTDQKKNTLGAQLPFLSRFM